MKTYNFRPSDYETIRSTGIFTTVIRLDIRERQDEEGRTYWECEEVEYNHSEPLTEEKDYGSLVSTLIRSKYSQDMAEAIVNNYLSSPDDEKYKARMKEFQEYRKESKVLAEEVIKEIGK